VVGSTGIRGKGRAERTTRIDSRRDALDDTRARAMSAECPSNAQEALAGDRSSRVQPWRTEHAAYRPRWQEPSERCPSARRALAAMLRPMRSAPLRPAAAACCLLAFLAAGARAAAPNRRPLVAVVGDNDGTEVTDFVIPYGVLSASGAADVVDVALHAGPLHLMPPAVTLAPKETIASFDAHHPAGADYVIVPAVHHSADADLLGWIQAQAARGATIVGVCDGVWVVAGAGLLANRSATGHWYSMSSLAKKFPTTHWVRDRRWVRDGKVITTTGVTASLPASLMLVEEIAGRERAVALAHELGVPAWDASHDSARFQLDRGHVETAAANWLAFWRWERVGVPIAPGIDEIGLAFTADALSRTYRSSSTVVAKGTGPITTRRGLTIVPDPIAPTVDRVEPIPRADEGPARALDGTLAVIAERYGPATASFVALQLEYPWNTPAAP
jgi:putative intracellular protease/amidase